MRGTLELDQLDLAQYRAASPDVASKKSETLAMLAEAASNVMQPDSCVAGLIGSTGISSMTQAQVTLEPGQCGRWQMMHDWNTWWGGGGMWFGPLSMILWLAVLVAIVVGLVRWLGGTGGGAERPLRSARDILDERYARGEIDRDEYLKRKQDIVGP